MFRRNKDEKTWMTMPVDESRQMASRITAANKGIGSVNDCRIAALKDIHKGKVGWLIGNGPSVRIEDLERLSNEVTFCCNRFYLAYENMNFRPTYLGSTDAQMIRDFGTEMVENHPGTVLFISNENPDIQGDYAWFQMKSRTPLEFSDNIYDFVMPGAGTLVTFVQIAYHMGITKFYMYGVDHNFTFEENKDASDKWEKAKGGDNHFIKNYRSGKPWSPPVMWQVEGALLACQCFLESKGGWIKNATRGGKLEVLERMDFDSVVPK